MLLSDLLGKPVLSLFSGTNEGSVYGAVFEKKLKKLLYLTVGKLPHEEETLRRLPFSALSAGGQAIVVRSPASLQPDPGAEDACEMSGIGSCEVWDSGGEYLGLLGDADLDEKGVPLSFMLADGGGFAPSQVLSAGPGTVILMSQTASKPPPPAKKPRAQKPKTCAQSPSAQENGRAAAAVQGSDSGDENGRNSDNADGAPDTPQSNGEGSSSGDTYSNGDGSSSDDAYANGECLNSDDTYSNGIEGGAVYGTIYADFSYLIGRKANADICGVRGERIVRRGEVVSQNTLAACKTGGRLLALARACPYRVYEFGE